MGNNEFRATVALTGPKGTNTLNKPLFYFILIMKSSIELIDFSETHAAGSLCLTSVFQRQK
jgi:hypothetical protein